jgi:hypothetical protein
MPLLLLVVVLVVVVVVLLLLLLLKIHTVAVPAPGAWIGQGHFPEARWAGQAVILDELHLMGHSTQVILSNQCTCHAKIGVQGAVWRVGGVSGCAIWLGTLSQSNMSG